MNVQTGAYYALSIYVQPLNSGRNESGDPHFFSTFRYNMSNATQYKKYKKIHRQHLLK